MHRFRLILNYMLIGILCIPLAACQGETTFSLTEAEATDEDTAESEETQREDAPPEALTPAESEDVVTQTEATSEEGMIYVYVCGQVVCPGVYCLPAGSRICDAVLLAGGCLDSADVNIVNQAERLTDGEKIYIPEQGEVLESGMAGASDSGDVDSSGQDSSARQSDTSSGRLNLNTATREELLALPGIGESKADAILEYRSVHGAFTSVEELMNISGIKEGVFNKVKDYIMVE